MLVLKFEKSFKISENASHDAATSVCYPDVSDTFSCDENMGNNDSQLCKMPIFSLERFADVISKLTILYMESIVNAAVDLSLEAKICVQNVQ